MAIRIALAALCSLVLATSAAAQTPKIEVLWLGQAAFRIKTPGGKAIVTDPWLLNNPLTPAEYKNFDNLGKLDLLLV